MFSIGESGAVQQYAVPVESWAKEKNDAQRMYKNYPLVSIIVPIYKVEQYLDRCVSSIVHQSYSNLEILLVDDGSPDKCPAMCDRWKMEDRRIRVIHKANGGLSDARNAGIEAARGEWILFVDSDDYILPQMVERLVVAAHRDQSDISVCSFFYDYGDHKRAIHTVLKPAHYVLDRLEAIQIYFKPRALELTVAWNKLYRRNLFFTSQRIRFPVGCLHEDEYTSYKLLYEADHISWINDELYGYMQRKGSIMSNFGPRNIPDLLGYQKEYFKWCKRYAPELRELIEASALNGILGWYLYCHQHTDFDLRGELREGLDQLMRKEMHFSFSNPYMGIKEKIKYIAWKLHLFFPMMSIWNLLKCTQEQD